MSQETDCLQYIIGLSQTDCECFEVGKPVDYSTSDSGIYLDQVEGLELNVINSIKNCEKGSLWDIMSQARLSAIGYFKADLIASLLTKYKQKRQPFAGVIGSQSNKSNLSLQTTYAGERIYASNIIGGVMKIKRIGFFMNADNSFNVEIRNEFDDDALYILPVSSQANKLYWNTVDIELPMNHETNDNPNYYITYPLAGMQPKNTTNGCGCSQSVYKYYWSIDSPKFKSYQKDRWSEFIMVTGISGNDLTDRENWATSSYNNGIFLDVEFKCEVSDLICDQDFDFSNNSIAIAMAYAIRYKAAFLLIDSILASSEINRFTMMDRERLMQKKNTYNTEYHSRLDWITNEINYKANDCLTCNDFDDIKKVGIFS